MTEQHQHSEGTERVREAIRDGFTIMLGAASWAFEQGDRLVETWLHQGADQPRGGPAALRRVRRKLPTPRRGPQSTCVRGHAVIDAGRDPRSGRQPRAAGGRAQAANRIDEERRRNAAAFRADVDARTKLTVLLVAPLALATSAATLVAAGRGRRLLRLRHRLTSGQ